MTQFGLRALVFVSLGGLVARVFSRFLLSVVMTSFSFHFHQASSCGFSFFSYVLLRSVRIETNFEKCPQDFDKLLLLLRRGCCPSQVVVVVVVAAVAWHVFILLINNFNC